MKKHPRMWRHEAAVLEAITRISGLPRRADVAEVSGYTQATVDVALHRLTRAGVIERVFHGRFRLSDRGKIALAVWQGQQQRRRAQRTASMGRPDARPAQ